METLESHDKVGEMLKNMKEDRHAKLQGRNDSSVLKNTESITAYGMYSKRKPQYLWAVNNNACFAAHMSEVIIRFKERRDRYREAAIRPLTPDSEELKALDEEVEKLRHTKKLVVDNFNGTKEVDDDIGHPATMWPRLWKKCSAGTHSY